jgi:SagB-type dehydrogenase family enzyme
MKTQLLTDQSTSVWSLTESRLIELGALGVKIVDGTQDILELISFGHGQTLKRGPVPPRLRPHPYTYLRAECTGAVLRNPISNFAITVARSGLIGEFFVGLPSGLSDPLREIVKKALWASGLAIAVEDSEKRVKYWQFEDILFHTVSRGRSDYRPRGATYPFKRAFQEPVRHVENQSDRAENSKKDARIVGDIQFADILKRRRSHRGRLEAATADQIASILRIATQDVVDCVTQNLPHSARPYPSAGGTHELGFYVIADRVTDLDRALYSFDHGAGILVRREADSLLIERLLVEASESWGVENGIPCAVIVLSAMVPLVTWKYESVGYRLVLLNAGVAMQTICQVATAAGVASCPLGTGDSELFSKIIGVAEWSETSVAEIAIAGSLSKLI